MGSRLKFLAVFLSAILVSFSSCQDHHWKPYEKVGPVETAKRPFSGVIAAGKVELGGSVIMRNFKGWSLFVVIRPEKGASMLAATKHMVDDFPVIFSATEKSIMVGKPEKGEKFIVEAKLDKDGNLDTKDEITVNGKAKIPIELGADNILITLELEEG